ncbi:MAG: hypothetical protein H6Q72_2642 [Firmicutes bacterium]|nr:hypothetical protein [Bacillota bacterium]
MRKILLCCLAILLLTLNPALAQERKDEWQDKNTVFRQFKTIVIHAEYDPLLEIDEISRKKLNSLLSTAIWQEKIGSIRWLTEEQLVQQIGRLSQTDMNSLKTSDPSTYAALLTEYTPKVADAQLTLRMRQWGYTQVYMPETWETYTRYRSVPVKVIETDAKGNRTVTTHWEQVPFEEMRLVPAHYNQISHAGLDLSLVSSKTGEKVWMLLDLRDADASKKPIDMTERIINRAVGRFGSLLD